LRRDELSASGREVDQDDVRVVLEAIEDDPLAIGAEVEGLETPTID